MSAARGSCYTGIYGREQRCNPGLDLHYLCEFLVRKARRRPVCPGGRGEYCINSMYVVWDEVFVFQCCVAALVFLFLSPSLPPSLPLSYHLRSCGSHHPSCSSLTPPSTPSTLTVCVAVSHPSIYESFPPPCDSNPSIPQFSRQYVFTRQFVSFFPVNFSLAIYF